MKLYQEVSTKVLKIYLLKYNLNEKKSVLSENAVVSLLNNIKKTLFLILQFHKSGKRIMFVGLTSKTKLFLTKHTKHISVTSDIDLKDFISKGFYLNSLENKEFSNQKVYKFRPDLVVLVSHYQKEMLLKECIRLKSPFIHYNFYSGFFELNSTARQRQNLTFNTLQQTDISYFFEICLLFLIKRIFKYPTACKQKTFKEKSTIRKLKNKHNYASK